MADDRPPWNRGLMNEAACAKGFAFFQRSVRFGMIVQVAIIKLCGGQAMEPGRVLVQKTPRLKIQLTAE